MFCPASEACIGDRGRLRTRLPVTGGLCLKPQHYSTVLETLPDVGWFEVHAENYLGEGGAPLHSLTVVREHYELSVHGVGLSIGSAGGLDPVHLKRVTDMVNRFEPAVFSGHFAWSSHDGQFHSDLLPLPLTKEVEDIVCDHINQIQDRMKRQILLENPANYLTLDASTLSEVEMLHNIVKRSGCGLLLDLNNVFISAHNCKYSALEYIKALPQQAIEEIHLAGHAIDDAKPDDVLLIDTHDREIADPVWQLLRDTLSFIGARATLIEWDTDVPEWAVFEKELQLANSILETAENQQVQHAYTD